MGLIVHGRFGAEMVLHDAVDSLRTGGWRVDVHVTWEQGDSERFAAEAVANGADVVVAAGGDGTLGEVVNGVFAAGPPSCAVGIVPLGTANDFATAFEIPTDDPLRAIDLIAVGKPRRIDVGRINGRYFINVASGGFGAEVTSQTPSGQKNLLGRISYLLTGLANMTSFEPQPVRLEGPGLSWEGSIYAIAVGNGRQAGGGFRVCPRARLDDGLLDVLVIPEGPRLEIFGLLDDLLLGGDSLPGQDRVLYHQLSSLRVETEHEIQFNLDGEPLCGHAFQFEVSPESLPFYLP